MERGRCPPRVEEMDMLATLVSDLMPTFGPLPAAVPLPSPFGPGALVPRAVVLLSTTCLALRSCPSPEEVRWRGVAGADDAARRCCIRRVCPVIAARVAVSP